MHIAYFNFRAGLSGNSQDRRRERRQRERAWRENPGRFSEGDVARVTVDDYGQRYKGGSVTIQGKDDEPGMWIVQSSRRKSPMVIADEHLEKIEVTAAVAAA